MYLMYVDESGDPGAALSPSKHFILSAIVVQETKWQDFLNDLVAFRRHLKAGYGLRFKDEIHASEFITGSPKFINPIPRNKRLMILKECLQWLDKRTDISVVTVRYDKAKGGHIFTYAWKTLIQRFENTINYGNFPHPGSDDRGMIIADNTDGGKLTRLLREMRKINYVTNTPYYGAGTYNLVLKSIIEDPYFKDSAASFIHQMVDVVAYFARQHYQPNKYIRTKGARHFYTRLLTNVANKYATTKKNAPNGIVEV